MRTHLMPGTQTRFVVGDVLCPDVGEVLGQIGPELVVTGEVMYLSDGGGTQNKFAVIRVAGIHAPLIVPANRLELADAVPDSDKPASTDCQPPNVLPRRAAVEG